MSIFGQIPPFFVWEISKKQGDISEVHTFVFSGLLAFFYIFCQLTRNKGFRSFFLVNQGEG
ncbi:hypothetical protein CWS01_16410 [Niallia nealsonii]|uniref:Uncharacterized protein n=1 Tax=Niallia nealsonii TaxID=115979 RepID=A0A2N0YZC8_9BACI|nr:hypothetical protein CWS01_16410 [Niallia nealsonii]